MRVELYGCTDGKWKTTAKTTAKAAEIETRKLGLNTRLF